jgi:hypothetical protein
VERGPRRIPNEAGQLYCPRCNQWLITLLFYEYWHMRKNGTKVRKYSGWCRECLKAYNRKGNSREETARSNTYARLVALFPTYGEFERYVEDRLAEARSDVETGTTQGSEGPPASE